MIQNALKIDGWMSSTELNWLAEQAKKHFSIIEIGSYLGRSTTALADNCPGIVYAVDPYEGPYKYDDGRVMMQFDENVYNKFLKNLARHIEKCKVVQVRSHFYRFNPIETPTFVFIDGDHRYHSVKGDLLHALRITKPGALISGHDYTHKDWPMVKKVVDEFFPKGVNIVDSIWWTIKS